MQQGHENGQTIIKEVGVMAKNKKEKRYVERDVSWMYFNHRILQEAQKENIPLLERLSFLGIYSNNLDEIFPCTYGFAQPSA